MNLETITKTFSTARLIKIGLAILIGVAFAGFFVGVNETHEPVLPTSSQADHSTANVKNVEPAVAYAELPEVNRSKNQNWNNNFNKLKYTIPSVTESVPTPDPEEFQVLLEKRSERRAYHGAPPMVPHQLDQRSSESCLICHGKPTRIESKIVPQMSHPVYQNCLQCHAEMDNPDLNNPPQFANAFKGLQSPGHGSRAWTGAPPVVPHKIHMREDCRSCHGVNGQPALRTTHPERQQCLQCHAPSAKLNQQPLLPPAFPEIVESNS